MKLRLAISWAVLAAVVLGQQPQRRERPVRLTSRGTHGAVAGGTEYATEAGMRMYYHGGNAVDAGVATMLAASVVEFSHFGFGGEAPILVRTKDGKVHAIAGVGTMPKLATAQFFRDHKLTDGALGMFQHNFRVYDREGQRCRTPGCGGTIRRIVQNGRSTFYCPVCQK